MKWWCIWVKTDVRYLDETFRYWNEMVRHCDKKVRYWDEILRYLDEM